MRAGAGLIRMKLLSIAGRLVITLYYLGDYPIDSEADFNQILASLEFYEPTLQIAESPASQRQLQPFAWMIRLSARCARQAGAPGK